MTVEDRAKAKQAADGAFDDYDLKKYGYRLISEPRNTSSIMDSSRDEYFKQQ